MNSNSEDHRTQVIGYSAYNPQEDCYEYNENACYVADDKAALMKFLKDALLLDDALGAGFHHEVKPVTISAMLSDFGCSLGEYALEAKAMKRFERLAELLGIRYAAKPYDDWAKQPPKLFVLQLEEESSG